jgi:hypothetical protein
MELVEAQSNVNDLQSEYYGPCSSGYDEEEDGDSVLS